MRRSQIAPVVIFVVLASSGAARAKTDTLTTKPPVAASTPLAPMAKEILKQISSGMPRGNIAREDWTAVAAYYSQQNGTALWVTGVGLTKRGQDVVAEIRRADDWGLSARAFDLPNSTKLSGSWADAEIKVSLAVLKYARFAKGGRLSPSQIDPNLAQSPKLLDPKRVLVDIAAATEAGAFLRSLHPQHPQFKLLRAALLRLRATHGAASIDPDPPWDGPGRDESRPDDDDESAAVRDGEPQTDEEELPWAQSRAGSKEPDTIRRIIVNMERWRWLPDDLGRYYVWDNIPEFITRVLKDGRMVYSDKIIVGKPSTPTPVFSARMQSIVFNPEWAVPNSIKLNDLLPRLRADPGLFGGSNTSVLREQNLRVAFDGHAVDPSQIDWANADIRRFDFFQAPGDQNVLGTLKFRFPNKYDVYMHDTPERALFNRSARALSHGCMRVGNPRRLAEVLLGEDKGWGSAEIGDQLATGNNTEVALTHPIPVHITYLTAIAHDNGTVDYFPDVYGYDTMMSDALEGRPIRRPVVSDATFEDVKPQRKSGGLDDFFSVLLGF